MYKVRENKFGHLEIIGYGKHIACDEYIQSEQDVAAFKASLPAKARRAVNKGFTVSVRHLWWFD